MGISFGIQGFIGTGNMEKNKSLSQDESKTVQSDLQSITNTFTDKVENITKTKINEIMEIDK